MLQHHCIGDLLRMLLMSREEFGSVLPVAGERAVNTAGLFPDDAEGVTDIVEAFRAVPVPLKERIESCASERVVLGVAFNAAGLVGVKPKRESLGSGLKDGGGASAKSIVFISALDSAVSST